MPKNTPKTGDVVVVTNPRANSYGWVGFVLQKKVKVSVQFVTEEGKPSLQRAYFQASLRIMDHEEEDAVLIRQCPAYKQFCMRYKRLAGVDLVIKGEKKPIVSVSTSGRLSLNSLDPSPVNTPTGSLGLADSMDVSTVAPEQVRFLMERLEHHEEHVRALEKKIDTMVALFQTMAVGKQSPLAHPQPELVLSKESL